MKHLWLILGILSLTLCVICVLYAALNLYGYHHVLDGSAGLYRRLHQRAVIFGGIGLFFAVLGAAGLFIRFR